MGLNAHLPLCTAATLTGAALHASDLPHVGVTETNQNPHGLCSQQNTSSQPKAERLNQLVI